MPENTKIEWTDHSWSPWRGCTKVSAGCANCYAETLADRFGPSWGGWGKGKPRVKAKNWNEPRKWQKDNERTIMSPFYTRPTVFPSLCDWLDDEVPIEWLAEFLQLIHDTPNLRWLLLTKRPENWLGRISEAKRFMSLSPNENVQGAWRWLFEWLENKSPANIWIGTSVEDQPNADKRIPELLKIPSVGRFVSFEPLLGPVELEGNYSNGRYIDPLHGYHVMSGSSIDMHGAPCGSIDWLIIGGESGHGARPCNVEWIRSLVRQGKDAGVPTFVKQFGKYPTTTLAKMDQFSAWREICHQISDEGDNSVVEARLAHLKGGDPAEWPEDLRVREFPKFN